MVTAPCLPIIMPVSGLSEGTLASGLGEQPHRDVATRGVAAAAAGARPGAAEDSLRCSVWVCVHSGSEVLILIMMEYRLGVTSRTLLTGTASGKHTLISDAMRAILP